MPWWLGIRVYVHFCPDGPCGVLSVVREVFQFDLSVGRDLFADALRHEEHIELHCLDFSREQCHECQAGNEQRIARRRRFAPSRHGARNR